VRDGVVLHGSGVLRRPKTDSRERRKGESWRVGSIVEVGRPIHTAISHEDGKLGFSTKKRLEKNQKLKKRVLRWYCRYMNCTSTVPPLTSREPQLAESVNFDICIDYYLVDQVFFWYVI
jgi:hypothetical protein